MKLSDKKNYKIKGKNNSRKKHNLRQKSTKHQKSKRRHPKKLDLKRKTMKIYVGGRENCISEDFPGTKPFVALKNVERIQLANTYFTAGSNIDCLEGTKTLFSKNHIEPFNIGSEEQVSINQMIEIIQEIANIKIEKEYQLDKPLGVRGRSSNNDLVREKLNWDIQIKLKDGLEKTYKWIYDEITSGKNNDKFSKSSY